MEDASSSNSLVVPQEEKAKASSNPRRPKQKATVKSLASDPIPSRKTRMKPQRKETILERIRKCLDRGRHPTTFEEEAKTAVAMAAKMMKQHNLTEAEVFAESGTVHDETPVGGESVVSVTHREGKRVQNFAFTSPLMHAMNTFFDCKAYHSTMATSFEYTFYGISRNTAAAAMAFEMCYNLIQQWALTKNGISTKHSYCYGVGYGLLERAKQEQEKWAADKDSQLIVVDGKAFADAYLRFLNIKLREETKKTAPKDMTAYKEGKEDSKKIDIRRRRLREARRRSVRRNKLREGK